MNMNLYSLDVQKHTKVTNQINKYRNINKIRIKLRIL